MRNVVVAVVAAVVAARAMPSARAQDFIDLDDPGAALLDGPEDYDVGNGGWNGLSTFAQLAAGDGFDVRALTAIDWAELTSEDILVILYPINALGAAEVAAFIRQGGRVVIGDDYGDSARALARLSITREQAFGVGAARFYDDLPYAPIAVPVDPAHPLAAGVAELVTNHPAVIADAGAAQPIFAFSPGEALVVAGELGYGRFVVLSDPSVLINSMLAHPGNFRFALNLLRHFDPGRRGRVVIVAGEFAQRGTPANVADDGSLRSGVEKQLRDLNHWLDELNDWSLLPGWMRLFAVLAGISLAVFAASALPLRAGAPLDGTWLRARARDVAGARGADVTAMLVRFDDDRYRGSYLVPVAILRDAVDARLGRALALDRPLSSVPAPELLGLVNARCGRRAHDLLQPVAAALQKLPSRVQAEAEWTGRFVPRREFERLHDQAEALLRALDEPQDPGNSP